MSDICHPFDHPTWSALTTRQRAPAEDNEQMIGTPAESSGRPSERPDLFSSLIDALHDSRRRQAERVLREHRHLIAHSGRRATHVQPLIES